MDTRQNRCSISLMWKAFAALLLLATPAVAREHATAYEALRVLGSQLGRDHVNRVIAVTGVGGDPQPGTWKIVIDDPRARGGTREVEVAGGRIVSERTPVRGVAGATEGATIKTARLNLDSSGAFTVASHTADKSGTQFDTASYTLRTDERGDPVWIVTLNNRSRPVGTIYIGANRGTVTRTEGLFAGATMDDVQTEEDRDKDNGHGIFDTARERITDTFKRAQREARGMFKNVRRSFADFIAGD